MIYGKSTKLYIKELSSTNLILPKQNINCKHVYHLFTVYHKKRDKIIKNLLKQKIETKTIYPYPIHKMKGYKTIFKGNVLLKKSENNIVPDISSFVSEKIVNSNNEELLFNIDKINENFQEGSQDKFNRIFYL